MENGNNTAKQIVPGKNRIGFHYYPDANHYRKEHLDTWLPKLKGLKAGWITLVASHNRGIPEGFIRGLIDASIEPIIHIHISPNNPPRPNEISAMLQAYYTWGVKYVCLFDTPNKHSQWEGARWAQQDLVERFLDGYLPLAEEICQVGLIPVFPPLEPGGDYWDTAFLRSALQSIERRGHQRLLERLHLGCYAWADNYPLNWGAGGPERWPGARPYFTPQGEEDHLGFRIFDWYTAISEAVLEQPLPILILAGGSRINKQRHPEFGNVDEIQHAANNLQIARLMARETDAIHDGATLETISENVLNCNFWLLAADEIEKDQAWFQADGTVLPIVENFAKWAASLAFAPQAKTAETNQQPDETINNNATKPKTISNKPINHYVLIPEYEWGIADWHLDVTRNYTKKHRAATGFSAEEACHANKVTVIGGEASFPDEVIQRLRQAGCEVLQISGDGTSIATQLENL